MPDRHQPHRMPEDAVPGAHRAAIVGGGLALVIVLVAVMSYVIWHAFGTPHTAAAPQAGPKLMQPAPQPARERYQREKDRLINSYGWVDRRLNIARIPIDEAMRMLAAPQNKDGS